MPSNSDAVKNVSIAPENHFGWSRVMPQELPNSTDLEESQKTSTSATNSGLQETSKEFTSGDSKAILEGATGFAKVLHQDERLVGGILISLPIVLIVIIPFTPEDQRLTLTCVTLGSVLVSSLVIFLLFRSRQKLEKETAIRNRELKITNNELKKSKADLEKKLTTLRNDLRDSVREKRAILFRVKAQVDQISNQTEILVRNHEVPSDVVKEVNQELFSVIQQIQDLLNILQRTQGYLADAEDLDAVDRSFDLELMERFEQRKKQQEQ